MNSMISIVIFALTTLSGGAIGAYFSGKLTERYDILNACVSLIQNMITYVNYSGYKLSEIFNAEKNNSRLYISDELIAISEDGRSIEEEWNVCITKSGYLKTEDRQILSELGKSIGKSNSGGEIAVLELAKERLNVQLKTAVEEKKRKGRLYCTLGIMLGAAVGIMLI